MRFTDSELAMIDATIGALCRRMSPSEHAAQLRVTYELDGHAIILFEERAPWCGEGDWSRTPAARFRLFRRRGEWMLYWMGANEQWDFYEGPRKRLATLVGYVEQDEHGCFFG